MKIRSLSLARVLETATAIAVVIYSALSVILIPYLPNWVGETQTSTAIIAVLISSVGLYTLIKLSTRGLLSYWARPILGKWAYESSSGNFALLYFEVEEYSINYRVDLYPTLEDILGALDGDPASIAKAQAHFTKRALTYEDGYVSIIYTIRGHQSDYRAREGILHVELLEGEKVMRGYWTSNITGEPSRGSLTIYREDAFRQIYSSALSSDAA